MNELLYLLLLNKVTTYCLLSYIYAHILNKTACH